MSCWRTACSSSPMSSWTAVRGSGRRRGVSVLHRRAAAAGSQIPGRADAVRGRCTHPDPRALHDPSRHRDGPGLTRIGSDCLLMAVVHVAHDCTLGEHVIIANNVVMGGHVSIGDHAVIGGAAALHQFVRIGRGAMVGGVSGVEGDVIPFGSVIGNRARLAGLNVSASSGGGSIGGRSCGCAPLFVPCSGKRACSRPSGSDPRAVRRRPPGGGSARLHRRAQSSWADPCGVAAGAESS